MTRGCVVCSREVLEDEFVPRGRENSGKKFDVSKAMAPLITYEEIPLSVDQSGASVRKWVLDEHSLNLLYLRISNVHGHWCHERLGGLVPLSEAWVHHNIFRPWEDMVVDAVSSKTKNGVMVGIKDQELKEKIRFINRIRNYAGMVALERAVRQASDATKLLDVDHTWLWKRSKKCEAHIF